MTDRIVARPIGVEKKKRSIVVSFAAIRITEDGHVSDTNFCLVIRKESIEQLLDELVNAIEENTDE